MCGFAGFLAPSGESATDLRATVLRMAARLTHRGPDDEGVAVDPAAGLALGFRRLSIVDLSPAGHQPMESDTGRYVLVFNGEIYNFAELRAELESRPDVRPFRGHSDTEVMLRAVEIWGLKEAVCRFVGMFAFALWDRAEQTLALGRDRMGEKPLYYGWGGDTFLFGSELSALKAHPAFRGEIDREALATFLRYGYVHAPRSIYRSVQKLPPGTILTLRRGDRAATPHPYWSVRGSLLDGLCREFTGTDQEAVDHLEGLLRTAVRRQMVADVPLGAFLSGGVDSSTVVALMQAQSSRPIKTFTIGFEEEEFNEAGFARGVARHLGTDHTELTVTGKEALEVIPQLPHIFDEPFADSSQIPTFLVAKLARQQVTVSLSGDGGDELFAGYGWYARTRSIWRKVGWLPAGARRAFSGALTSLTPAHWDSVLSCFRPVLPQKMGRAVTGDKVHKLASLLAHTGSPEAVYDALVTRWDGHAPVAEAAPGSGPTALVEPCDARADLWQRLMYRDQINYLPDNILTKVDRASMAVSLEARAPLLDHRVVEFAWQVPARLKVRGGSGKWLLRQVLQRHVPRELIDRPKMGFCVPIGTWLRGPLRAWAEDLLSEASLGRCGLLDVARIRRTWQEHQSGARQWPQHLWNVLMFQAWLGA